ncbi:hypothetical protein GF312_18015 [Candidatus Poribacteria bacterium]|nr:hypothetical protein [Candidatus Poribacteria bacterium]
MTLLKKVIELSLLFSVCIFLVGCATYGSKMEEVRVLFSQNKYEQALEKLEDTESGRSRLLYLLEKGMLLHYADRYKESNSVFEEAELLSEDLYTKSISREASAFLTSDNIRPYEGEKFEIALIHYYRAFNYIYLDLPDDALVECRKVSFLLQRYKDNSQDKSTAYSDDAFMQYLSGMLFEWQGEINDAFISYRKAEEAYQIYEEEYNVPMPPSLKEDLIRTAKTLGFIEEYNFYINKYGKQYDTESSDDNSGKLVVIHENGFAPVKDSVEIVLPILKKDDLGADVWKYSGKLRTRAGKRYDDADIEYLLRVSIPEYKSNRPRIKHMHVKTDGIEISASKVEDVEAIAFKNFQERQPIILLRTIARGLTKYLAYRQVRKKSEGLGLLANIVNVATESADTRSWLTLPNSFSIARLNLPPGKHNISLIFYDERGRKIESADIPDVEIKSGSFSFINYRTFQ